jgi:hypothetical protein
VKEEYHLFLEATTKFIWEIQQRQLVWRWSAESGVYGGVSWMQGLWASRKSVRLPFLSIFTSYSSYIVSGCLKGGEVRLKWFYVRYKRCRG